MVKPPRGPRHRRKYRVKMDLRMDLKIIIQMCLGIGFNEAVKLNLEFIISLTVKNMNIFERTVINFNTSFLRMPTSTPQTVQSTLRAHRGRCFVFLYSVIASEGTI